MKRLLALTTIIISLLTMGILCTIVPNLGTTKASFELAPAEHDLHMSCFTIIGNDLVEIEPQYGRVWKFGQLDTEEASIDAYNGTDLVPFRDKGELGCWVLSTGIHKNKYIKDDYDCDDFAIDLWKLGMKDNRLIGLLIIKNK